MGNTIMGNSGKIHRFTASDRRAEKAVDELERKFPEATNPFPLRNDWDHDMARRIIARHIPLTAAEADDEFDAMIKETGNLHPSPTKSLLGELKEVLGYDKGLSIKETLKGAIERIKGQEV